MTALDHIKIAGFKSIRDLDLELNALNILIGANGAGKSNFIEVFALLNQIVNQNLQNYVRRSGGADNMLYFGQKNTDEIHLYLEFADSGYRIHLQPSNDDSLFFSDEKCTYNDRHHFSRNIVDLSNGHLESNLIDETKKRTLAHVVDMVVDALKSWKIYQFHDTSDTAKIKGTSKVNDNLFLRPDASNLASFLYRLQKAHFAHYDRIVKTIRRVAPFFDDFQLQPDRLNEESIRLEWREKGSDQYFNAHSLSDGTLRFMSMVTLLLQPDELLPATILIDEPELGLHPYAINILAGLLESTSAKTQIIVATQSVPLVNQFTPEDIIVVDREDGQSTFKHLDNADVESWMDNYGLGDLWEKNVIGGRPQR